MLERILGPLTKRWPWLRTALAVQSRFSEVKGNYLAAAITLNLFLSIFPMLLVAIAVVGFITSGGSTDIAEKIIANFGLNGQAAQTVNDAVTHAAQTKRAASAIGLLGLLWSGLGVVAAIEYALDSTWQLTGRGIKDKARGVLWMLGGLTILGISIALTAAFDWVADGWLLSTIAVPLALLFNFAYWIWTFVILSFRRLPLKAYLPGAVIGAIGLEVITQAASILPGLFNGSSALYGSLGVVFAILTTLLLFGRLLVYSSTLNVVTWEGHHGTVTVDIEVPKVPGEVPLETDRGGAMEPPDDDQ